MIPKYIIIHSITHFFFDRKGLIGPKGETYECLDLLKIYKSSAHKLFYPHDYVHTMVSSNKIAFHAGVSKWGKDEGLNKMSLGYELVVGGVVENVEDFYKKLNTDWCSPQQYENLLKQVTSDCLEHDISPDFVLLHSEVAGPDVRGPKDYKRDPGSGFPKAKFIEDLKLNLSKNNA